jgi:hypothetical protein
MNVPQLKGMMPKVLLGTGRAFSKKRNVEYDVPKLTVVGWEHWDPEAAASPPEVPSTRDAMSDAIPF